MIYIEKKENCCGCSACKNICPQKCIDMKRDAEGFLYPHVRTDHCTNCGLCETVCPICNHKKESEFEQTAYIIQHKNKTVRQESTSGGAFTAIAECVIERGGVVFGAGFDENFKVRHTYVEHKNELFRFRGSKYVQSDIENTYTLAKKFLSQGRWVCFSGTPCQIEGLKAFLSREYDCLITVDVVCRAVPSPLIFEKYLQAKGIRDLSSIKFRDKQQYGYQYTTMSLYTGQNKNLVYSNGIDTDQMLRAFFSNICDRPSCHQCRFKKRYRVSDFTLWDCFDVCRYSKQFDDNLGTTNMLIHTEKGNRLFEAMKHSVFFQKTDADRLIQTAHEMTHSTLCSERRNKFFADVNKLDADELFQRYFPNTFKNKSEKYLRRIAYKTGMYRLVRRVYKFVFGDKKR